MVGHIFGVYHQQPLVVGMILNVWWCFMFLFNTLKIWKSMFIITILPGTRMVTWGFDCSCFDERGNGLPESFGMEMSAGERLKKTSKWNKARAVFFNVWLWFPRIYVWIYGCSLPWSVPWPIGSERGWTHIHRLIVIVAVKLVMQFCCIFKQMT